MSKKVLVVVDMQNDFLDGVLGNEGCLATVPEVVNLIHNGGYSAIIYSQDTHNEDYLNTQEGKRLPVIHCVKGTDGWKLNSEVKEAICNYVRNKGGCTFSYEKNTFGGLVLMDILREDYFEDCDEIHFCGVCTGICVISNVMITKAALPEARVCVHKDACACVTPESHKTALEAMKMCQIDSI